MRVKMRSVRPTVASAAGTKDLQNHGLSKQDLKEIPGWRPRGAHVANEATEAMSTGTSLQGLCSTTLSLLIQVMLSKALGIFNPDEEARR